MPTLHELVEDYALSVRECVVQETRPMASRAGNAEAQKEVECARDAVDLAIQGVAALIREGRTDEALAALVVEGS